MKTANYEAWAIQPLFDFATQDMLTLQRHLVSWAVLAGNAHNSQPWRFVLRPAQGVIDVHFDEAGLTGASDPTTRQSTLSVGCAIENLRLAAEQYGLSPVVTLADKAPTAGQALASIQLSAASKQQLTEQNVARLGAIRDRRMNRSKFEPKAVPEAFVQKMKDLAKSFNVTCTLLSDTATRLAISELQYMADRAVIALPAFRHELQQLFLENDSPASRGMPGATFGMSDEMTARVVKDLGSEGLFNPDWANGFAMAGRDGIRSAPLLAVVTCPQDSTKHWLQVGSFFQRCAVDAQQEGLAVAVHAALVESAGLNALLRARLHTLARPTMVFRIGYATQQRPHAPRLAAAAVTTVV